MRNKATTLILLLILLVSQSVKAQKLAVGTNALTLATGIINAGAEMNVGRSSTVALSLMSVRYPWSNSDIEHIGLQPEWRYYFSGRPMYHHFVGIAGIMGTYNLHFGDKKYEGSAAGVGLTFGYVLNLTNRLNMDLHWGFGIINAQDRQWGNKNYMLPTKAGITISYIIR